MTVLPPEVDRWVSEEFSRLAEIVQDYEPSLELRWIPYELRATPDDRAKPYCIVDTKNNYVVMYASELDTPVNILAKLFEIDTKNGDVMDKIIAQNRAAQAFKLKEQMEEIEEATDLAVFALRNEKNYWKHNGVKYDSEMRRLE